MEYSWNGELIKEYSSYGEAARITGIAKSQISKATKTTGATAGGYFWKDVKNSLPIEESIISRNNQYNDRKKKVYQYSLDGKFITAYDSLTDAAKAINKPSCSSAIGRVCRGEQKTSCGYKWSYDVS